MIVVFLLQGLRDSKTIEHVNMHKRVAHERHMRIPLHKSTCIDVPLHVRPVTPRVHVQNVRVLCVKGHIHVVALRFKHHT